MTTILLLTWLVSSVPAGLVMGRYLARRPAARQMPARLSPRAELPRLDRSLFLLGLLAAVAVAFATRGQVVTWDGVAAVPVR